MGARRQSTTLKIDQTDWGSAVSRALVKPRPPEGWPERPKRAAKKKAAKKKR
jgi:hypothetical protein